MYGKTASNDLKSTNLNLKCQICDVAIYYYQWS